MMCCRIPVWMGLASAAISLSTLASAADVKQTLMSSTVDSPSIGYVVRTPDAASGVLELRAMLGVPGSARFSDPIALPDGTTAAEVAPGQKWVLAIRSNEAVSFVPETSAATSIARIGTPSAWAFSPSGARVALFYPDRGNVVLLSGLPGSPKLDSTLRIAQADEFAISDNGVFVYTIGNRILKSDGGLVYQASGPMAFEAGRDLLVVYDSDSAALMEVAATDGSKRQIAGGMDAPDQLLASADRIYAANTATGTVALIEYADGSLARQNVKVSRLSQSAITGTVLVSFDTNDPAWLVNAQGISFVPAIVSQQQGIQ